MTIRREKEVEPVKEKALGKIFLIALAVIFIGGLIYFLFPQAFRSFAYFGTRVKNTFFIICWSKHRILLSERGKKRSVSARVGAWMLEVTYRDEFGIVSVGSDDLTGKRISVRVQELEKGGNDIRVLMRGIDLVNKIMTGGPRRKTPPK